MPKVTSSLWDELETSVQWGSAEKRLQMLQRVTDLLLEDPDRLTEEQIEVLCYLINVIESKALVEISRRLAPVERAPIRVVRQLARDDEVNVAAPMLSLSPRLTAHDLVEIASAKDQGHLLRCRDFSASSNWRKPMLLWLRRPGAAWIFRVAYDESYS